MKIRDIENIILGMAEIVSQKRYYEEKCERLEKQNYELCKMLHDDVVENEKSTKEVLSMVLTKTMKDIDEFYNK